MPEMENGGEMCGHGEDYSHICNGETWENVDREKKKLLSEVSDHLPNSGATFVGEISTSFRGEYLTI